MLSRLWLQVSLLAPSGGEVEEEPGNQNIGRIWHRKGEGHPGGSKSHPSLTSASCNCTINTYKLCVSDKYVSRDTSLFTLGFGINIAVVILISPTAIASGFGGSKAPKHLALQVEPSSPPGLILPGMKHMLILNHVNKGVHFIYQVIFRWGTKVTPYCFIKKHVFPKIKHHFCRRAGMSFHAPPSRLWQDSPWMADGTDCVSAGRCLDETRDSTANLLQILCNTQGDSVLVTLL